MRELLLSVFGLGLMLLTACTAQIAKPLDKVSLQLKWLPSAQFAGIYLAKEEGYYAEANIDLTLLPGGSGSAVDAVMTGEAQFGIWAGDSLLAARSQGQTIKAVAALFQISPTAYFSLAERGIKTPADLKGKRVAWIETTLSFPVVLGSAGLSKADIITAPISRDMTPLLAGEVDVWAGYVTDQVITLEGQGYDLNVILAYDYGAYIYSDILFATDKLVKDDPDLVRRVVEATLRGWEYALAHPDLAVEAVLKADPQLDKAHLEREMNATIPLVDTGQVPLGFMDDFVWQTTQDIMVDAGLISAPIELKSLYTNEFIQNIP